MFDECFLCISNTENIKTDRTPSLWLTPCTEGLARTSGGIVTSVHLERETVMCVDVTEQCAVFKKSNEGNGNSKGYSPNQDWEKK